MKETLSCRSRSVKKVITAILLCMLLVTSAAPASVSATTNGKTRDDAVNWICARGNEHWTYPYGETWCVSLIVAYYNWLGVGSVMRIIRFQADGHEYTAIHSQETLQYGVQVHPLDGEITNPMQIILMVM